MSKSDLRDFLKDAEQLGFEFDGYNGGGHVRLRNPDTGHTYAAAFTPSDHRSRRNSIAGLQRLSGQRLPRQKTGKHRHRRQVRLDTTLSVAEKQASNQVAALVEEAGWIRRRIDHLTAEPTTRNAAAEVRRHLTRYRHLRSHLRRLHHNIPAIVGTE